MPTETSFGFFFLYQDYNENADLVCCTSRRSDNNPSVVIWLRRVKVAVCSMLSKRLRGKEKSFLDNKYFIQLKKYIKKKTCQMRESDEKKKQELAEKKTKKKEASDRNSERRFEGTLSFRWHTGCLQRPIHHIYL